jgi:hypothetical protein
MNIQRVVLTDRQLAAPAMGTARHCKVCKRRVYAGQPLILIRFGSEASYQNRTNLIHDRCLRERIGHPPVQARTMLDAAQQIAAVL